MLRKNKQKIFWLIAKNWLKYSSVHRVERTLASLFVVDQRSLHLHLRSLGRAENKNTVTLTDYITVVCTDWRHAEYTNSFSCTRNYASFFGWWLCWCPTGLQRRIGVAAELRGLIGLSLLTAMFVRVFSLSFATRNSGLPPRWSAVAQLLRDMLRFAFVYFLFLSCVDLISSRPLLA